MRPAGGCAKGTAGLIIVLCCAQVSAADFWIDGNLTGLEELTQSGNQHFVTNAGFTDGKNYEMVFGSAIARGLGGPTALYNDERRAKVATEILVLLAQQPSLDGEEVESPQEFLQKIGLRAEAIAHANDLLITYTRKYVKATSLPARAHNNLAKQLRDIDPRTIKTLAGRKVHTSNLQHFGAYLEILDGALMISDIAVGASLRAAVQADIALTRLEILQATLERNPDPAIRNAIRNAQQVLDLGEDFWGALVVEMDARSADIQKFGAQVVLHRSEIGRAHV